MQIMNPFLIYSYPSACSHGCGSRLNLWSMHPPPRPILGANEPHEYIYQKPKTKLSYLIMHELYKNKKGNYNYKFTTILSKSNI